MPEIYTLEQIREKLKDRKVSVVCKKLSLSRQAFYNILNGKNISYKTYKKLIDYLFATNSENL